ncbi:MAG: DUF1109 domain-containing protein [Betaproteobacteria bacterium]|jgi:hypothetical protein
MKTARLIEMLAEGVETVPPGGVPRRHAAAFLWGIGGALLLMVPLLGLRADLGDAVRTLAFWGKGAWIALLLAGAVLALARLSRPGCSAGRAWFLVAAPVLALWCAAAAGLAGAAPDARLPMVFGQTWRTCPLLVALLSLPMLAASFQALRGLAPTRPVLAGWAAGLVSGALGALVYCLHCTESAAPFLGTWYLLGILIPAVAGAVLGPRWLRW